MFITVTDEWYNEITLNSSQIDRIEHYRSSTSNDVKCLLTFFGGDTMAVITSKDNIERQLKRV